MRGLALLAFAAATGIGMLTTAPKASAQVGVGVEIGPAPVCPYGYYEVPPYNCAPYGYYGPEWFVDGAFIGAGPWYHGPERFWGHVDHHYHPSYGYRGPYPERGARAEHRVDRIEHFHGNAMHDGRGHERH